MHLRAIILVILCACLCGCARAELEPASLQACSVHVDPDADDDMLTLIEGRCVTAQNLDLGRYSAAYDRYSLAHRASSLHTQRWYGIIAMGFVVLLVISGITITVLEFLAGNRGAAKFKFGATGVEVDSKFLGITVLVISLAFAYLFLEKAYQIEEIRGENAAEEPGAIPAEEQETETTADPRPEVSASNSGAGVLPGNGGL